MGYSMYQCGASFRIKRENIPEAMKAIRDLAGVEEGEPTNTYSWVPKKFYEAEDIEGCLLYTSPSPRDLSTSRMPSSA